MLDQEQGIAKTKDPHAAKAHHRVARWQAVALAVLLVLVVSRAAAEHSNRPPYRRRRLGAQQTQCCYTTGKALPASCSAAATLLLCVALRRPRRLQTHALTVNLLLPVLTQRLGDGAARMSLRIEERSYNPLRHSYQQQVCSGPAALAVAAICIATVLAGQ